MNFGEFRNRKAQQPLPPSLAVHEAEIGHFASLCSKTCAQILSLLALGLEVYLSHFRYLPPSTSKRSQVEPTFFTIRHDPKAGPTGSILRLLYYPSLSSPSTAAYKHGEDERAGAHSDYGSITLLFQRAGQPGLEILGPDGSWAPVPVFPDGSPPPSSSTAFPPILVNIGDLLTYWTDGLLKSTVHRVVFPAEGHRPQDSGSGQDRYSVVYFCHPLDTAELVPVPSEIVAAFRENGRQDTQVGFGGGAGSWAPGKRALTAAEHLESRLNATYNFRKNVQ